MCKVVLIGAEGVGKTSLKRNYMGQGFRSSHLLTLGTEFSHKLINIDENITLNAQIWDLASQSAFESIRKQKNRASEYASTDMISTTGYRE